ncbi:hypothetical protein MSAN_00488700 [Mycena sanguinolenta]|uniref:F-box domain-containing protein n=1 Tax=Mycena sanguinolenta TaxID=230812 RepID=A0A8H6Z8F6_9AGAR|nr:hypothetical protein MSAN_00488700 [Mycena sanguinolenta]
MVLTRRAVTAYKSIIRWLPNEILTTMMLHLSQQDLVVLCRTSRLFRNLATPLLYRCVSLSTDFQVNSFVRMITRRSATSLCHHVRQLYLTKVELKLSLTLVKSMTSVISRLVRLEVLDLFLGSPVEFTDLLRDAYFPHLTTFQYTLRKGTLLLLPAFLNRHPTISTLGLTRIEPIDINAEIALLDEPISLPNLGFYNGPSGMVRTFGPGNSIKSACLFWYPGDSDTARPLLHLGAIATSSLVALMPICLSDHPARVMIMQSAATHLPHIRILKFARLRGVAGRISREDAREIATCLEKFSALAILELDKREDAVDNANLTHDRETILLWSGSCKSLLEIVLHGRVWISVRGHWRSA